MPQFKDDGDTRTPISIQVGSGTAVSPYTVDIQKDRSALVCNPSANFVLYLATFAEFTPSRDVPMWFIHKDSSCWETAAHQAFYMRYEAKAPSETIRILLEKQ